MHNYCMQVQLFRKIKSLYTIRKEMKYALIYHSYFAAIGNLRPEPNALGVTLRPGAA
jgi:hypothetical protein